MENLLPTKFTVRGDRMCEALTGSSQVQKYENKLISSVRVVNEHAIAGIKRLKAASDC
jgi:23S rRNA maturation-related 3'-5' exoribonuclease YhaM